MARPVQGIQELTPTVTSESVLQHSITLSPQADNRSVHFRNNLDSDTDDSFENSLENSERDQLMPRPPEDNNTGPGPILPQPDDRKNEYFAMKRFIFLSFGVPGGPVMDPKTERCLMFFSIPFYFILEAWGALLISVPLMEDNYIWARRCPTILPAKGFTIVAGVFFIALGVYWFVLFSWSRWYSVHTHAHNRNFAPLAFTWWLLSMFFCIVTTGLTIEICTHSDLVLSLGGQEGKFVECKGTRKSQEWDDSDFLYSPMNTIPVWALGSMVLLLLLYFCIFIINAVKLHKLSRHRVAYIA